MKIGTFSKKLNVPTSTVRYYIEKGILIPNKNNSQYNFTEKNIYEMEMIIELKNLKFNLNEIQNFLHIIRLYDYRDEDLYARLWNIYNEKKSQLLKEVEQLQQIIYSLDEKMYKCKNHQILKSSVTGVPTDFIGYLSCPNCGKSLNLNNVKIQNKYILCGDLFCDCGYFANIEDGILLNENKTQKYNKFDFLDSYFYLSNQNIPDDIDFVSFYNMEDINSQVASYMQKSYDWLDSKIRFNEHSKNVILVPDIAAHFLYKNINSPYFKDSFIIVSGFSKKTVSSIKSHIDLLSPDLNIVYIANTVYSLPIKTDIVDLFIDSFASFNFSFFHNYSLISKLYRYLKNNASIYGATHYYSPYAQSVKNIKKLYPDSQIKHPVLSYFQSEFLKFNIKIEEDTEIGKITTPGKFFDYHEPGDTLYLYSFYGNYTTNHNC